MEPQNDAYITVPDSEMVLEVTLQPPLRIVTVHDGTGATITVLFEELLGLAGALNDAHTKYNTKEGN